MSTPSPLPTVSIVPIAIAAVAIFGLVSGPVFQSIQANEEKAKYQLVDQISENKDVPEGGVRIIIVNSKNSWEKAVKISKKSPSAKNWEFVKEIKCGDASGSTAKSDGSIRYDQCRIEFDGSSEYQLEYRKPSTFGVWTTPATVLYHLSNQNLINGRTLYVYFDNDSDGYFTKHPEHRLTADKLF